MSTPAIQIGDVWIGPGRGLALIAGPCVIESSQQCLRLGQRAAAICRKLGIGYIFKASFDKANRTSIDSYRGPGLQEGLRILAGLKDRLGVPILSDIHEPGQARPAAEVLDVLQIPAFLARQTDLVVAAARTGRALNIKKGQFMAPQEMAGPVGKARSAGNERILLTERGSFFGYHRLVNDMTAIEVMRAMAPVVFDATHSTQQPGARGDRSGGQRRFVPLLARAAVAAGADALFLEIHQDPDRALSDAAVVWPIDRLESVLTACLRIAEAR